MTQISIYFYYYQGFFQRQARKMDNLSQTALDGKEALTALTGCEQPCESIGYNVIPLATWNMKYNRDLRAQGAFITYILKMKI